MVKKESRKRFHEDAVGMLALVADLNLDEESQRTVGSILEQQIGHLRTLPLYDITEADPEFVYDPRWNS